MRDTYEDNEIDNDDGLTTKDFKELAKSYIRIFFSDKTNEFGSVINPEDLITERNISLVLNTSICDGLPLIYETLKPILGKSVKKKGQHADDVQLVLKLLREMAKLSLPKTSFTGLIAIYLEVCKGYTVDIDDEP